MAGQTPRSLRAFANLKRICEEHLAGDYRIEIVDLLENPKLAEGDQILAIPTVVRRLPGPFRKIIGDLSETEKVLIGLDIVSRATPALRFPGTQDEPVRTIGRRAPDRDRQS